VVERVPTPPPPRKGGVRRFSGDVMSPPMPKLPSALRAEMAAQAPMSAPAARTEHESVYDSLCVLCCVS
jgi:hypothetical protein